MPSSAHPPSPQPVPPPSLSWGSKLTRKNQIPHPPLPEQALKVRVRKRALARLVQHDLARHRVQLGDGVVAALAADQEAAEGAGGVDAEGGGVVAGAEEFAGGEGGEVGGVAWREGGRGVNSDGFETLLVSGMDEDIILRGGLVLGNE